MDIHETWRYKLKQDYRRQIDNHPNIEFSSEWFTVQGQELLIKQGYAWNGCSPAYMLSSKILGFSFWIGTPDGIVDLETQLPQSWQASMVHDAFCQYRAEMNGVPKAFTVNLFKTMLLECGFPKWKANLYAESVNLFGPQDWK